MQELIDEVKNLTGFKIDNTHFRIGSKIHISKFYYAKRFFQNSFFASRVAFLITKEILESHKNRLNDFKTNGLTLIGYGLYSELLLSLIEKFLKKRILGTDKKSNKQEFSLNIINHDLISDLEKPSFIKGIDKIHKYIIIIVPISSTFSTSIKIEEYLSTELGNELEAKIILEPYLNVLYVGHDSENERVNKNGCYEIEEEFGWKEYSLLEKKIKLQAFFTEKEEERRIQKYLLRLPSEWHKIETCKLCYPDGVRPTEFFKDKLIKEKPLFFTDKTSVTPTLIFDYPKARIISDNINKQKPQLSPETLNYGHVKRDNNHYHYYINIEKFFYENNTQIINWLKVLYRSDTFKINFSETDHVVILAPGHHSNSSFVNCVNEFLFSNAANILHYEASTDHIQNFEKFYGELVSNSKRECKVVYVDDTITSGNTFFRTNRFIQFTRKGKKADNGFDACIVLLDRSNRFTHSYILDQVESYYSFANIHLPSLKDIHGECPLCIEADRYNRLFENSFLDRMKVHFLIQGNKLTAKSTDAINKYKQSRESDYRKTRYTSRVEAIHRINEWCLDPKNDLDTSFEEWKINLLKDTESPFKIDLLSENNAEYNELYEDSATLLKVLTQPPFLNYKPLRIQTFKWILIKLKKHLEYVNKAIENDEFTYSLFRDLKFLIRRAGLLNTNFLISRDMFEYLEVLYSQNGLKKIESQIVSEIKWREGGGKDLKSEMNIFYPKMKMVSLNVLETWKNSIQEFHVYFTAQIKELLYLNEARSIRLEETVKKISLEKNLSPSFRQLLRFVMEENGILIQKYWEFIMNEGNISDATYESIKLDYHLKLLKNTRIVQHYRTNILVEFFKKTEDETNLIKNEPLVNFLKLRLFLEIEKNEQNLSLIEKTNYIMNLMNNIICTQSDYSGSFLLINFQKDNKPFLASNKGESGPLNELDVKNNQLLLNFLEGNKFQLKTKSIIEYSKNGNNWNDKYATIKKDVEINDKLEFLPSGCNRLLLVRFSKINITNDNRNKVEFVNKLENNGQALAGFYYKENSDIIKNISQTRYLLLLRSAISDFIESHHENDEFRDWVEADKIRKLSLLSGHGREMLMDIARINNDGEINYKDIILNLEHLQMIVALDQNIYEIKKVNNLRERFQKFYNVEGVKEIKGKELRKRLNIMAKQIFSSKEIENEVTCIVNTNNIDSKIEFAFNKQLLDMIFFELLINAKKNRWHFIDNEEISGNKKNVIRISAKVVENKLNLEVSNTGPMVELDTMKLLEKKQNPKKSSDIAGISLLQALLKDYGLGLGELTFFQEPIDIDAGFYRFTAKLTLNEMSK